MAPKSITVDPFIRRDGKYKAVYHFPISGRHITKILTLEQIIAESAKGYTIHGIKLPEA